MQLSVEQESAFELFDFEVIGEGLRHRNHLIVGIDIQLGDRDFPLKAKPVLLQVTQIDFNHNDSQSSRREPWFFGKGHLHVGRHERADITPQLRDFFDNPRT